MEKQANGEEMENKYIHSMYTHSKFGGELVEKKLPMEWRRRMATRTGRQALLNNRCRKVADSGRIDRPPPRRRSPPPPVGSENRLPLSDTPSPKSGGEDTNKSLSLWPTDNSLPLSGDLTPSKLRLRSGEPPSHLGGSLLPAPPPARPSSILRMDHGAGGRASGWAASDCALSGQQLKFVKSGHFVYFIVIFSKTDGIGLNSFGGKID
ncbi:zinc finger and BTB domain-containing protein 46 [Striga asiatica]|uniref:Zinc finger and BTB domain-containing protein 46 n=1 Tax=Striga asiatica TaxID=4170 RepID=A0A5A7PSF3_STRAF|nr:zinc finger and BTB domain-containing protein 46 [Striga asiatica]